MEYQLAQPPRWDTAVVMAELSGLNTITAKRLDTWEAEIALACQCGVDVDIPTPNPFGWGHHHCLCGVGTRGAYLGDETGARSSLAGLTPEQVAGIRAAEVEYANRLELGMLARRDPRSETAVWMAPSSPGPTKTARGCTTGARWSVCRSRRSRSVRCWCGSVGSRRPGRQPRGIPGGQPPADLERLGVPQTALRPRYTRRTRTPQSRRSATGSPRCSGGPPTGDGSAQRSACDRAEMSRSSVRFR
jgi:hypothetical protein